MTFLDYMLWKTRQSLLDFGIQSEQSHKPTLMMKTTTVYLTTVFLKGVLCVQRSEQPCREKVFLSPSTVFFFFSWIRLIQ